MINMGLLGAASITPRSVISPCGKLDNIDITGIASTVSSKAEAFAQKYGISTAFTDYQSLIDSKDVDAVYMALPNSLHAQWCIAAGKAKKHILVEKPLCLTPEDAARISRAVQENNVFLLEGVMTQHHPWERGLIALVKEQRLGKLKGIKTVQTFRLNDKNSFRFMREYGGGVFFDESCYWLRLLQALELFPLQKIQCEADPSFNGQVDTTCKIRAEARGGVDVEALFSYDMPYEAVHFFTFTEGTARIRNYLAPSLGDFRIRIETRHASGNDTGKETITFTPDNYFYRQLAFFAEVIEGKNENIPLSQSTERIDIMSGIHDLITVLT
jgi:dTDP-3,4-didehydro-2,6-dideoxy-alpha-D-glucose 3-reductase